jgi:hypothetical protein
MHDTNQSATINAGILKCLRETITDYCTKNRVLCDNNLTLKQKLTKSNNAYFTMMLLSFTSGIDERYRSMCRTFQNRIHRKQIGIRVIDGLTFVVLVPLQSARDLADGCIVLRFKREHFQPSLFILLARKG